MASESRRKIQGSFGAVSTTWLVGTNLDVAIRPDLILKLTLCPGQSGPISLVKQLQRRLFLQGLRLQLGPLLGDCLEAFLARSPT